MAEDQQFCEKHPWERADDTCRQCRYGFCGSCLVYTNGAERPPLCVSCALALSGVRRSARVAPRETWWQQRRARREVVAATPATTRPEGTAVESTWDTLDERAWVTED